VAQGQQINHPTFAMTRPELFEGAELLESESPYDDAYKAGLSAPYVGPNRLERYKRPDGTEFTWESEIFNFGHQRAEITFYIGGIAAYRMITRADITGWHDGPWRAIEGEVVDDPEKNSSNSDGASKDSKE